MAWDRRAPYTEDGSLLSYPDSWYKIVWRPVEPFAARLRILNSRRGRSSATIAFVDTVSGREYEMFFHDFVELAKLGHIDAEGCIDGRWTVVKRGRNFAIAAVVE